MNYDVKQVLVVRKDLNMRKGKIAAQVAHASMKVFLDRATVHMATKSLTIENLSDDMVLWLVQSFAKICVSVDSELELELIYEKAKQAGLPCALIVDAGHTEFHGIPTKTVVAIGPAHRDLIDPITRDLKLL